MFDERILEIVRNGLIARSETLAVAESVTGGLLQFAFAQAKDASYFFQGGITAYNLGQKCVHLHVEPIHAQSCDCVSASVSEQMALSVASMFSADWGVSVTGYATRTESIRQPFSFFYIVRLGETMASGRLDSTNDEGFETQRFFAAGVLEKLAAVL